MKNKSNLLVVLLLIVVFTFGSGRNILAQEAALTPAGSTGVSASITPVMSYQGRLLEGGVPVTDIRSITFKLFNVASGGTALWTETQTVTVTNGMFQVALGSVTPLTEAVLGQMSQNLWLEITVGSTILPRQQLMGAPYALSLAPGATVTGSTARTLSVGNLVNGTGIWSHSATGHGIIATSDGVGLSGAALQSQAYNQAGIAIWALSDGTDATLVTSNDGSGPLVKGFGGDGGEYEYAILNDGSFLQDLTASGLVKAAVYALCADGASSIVRSFNNVGSEISITYGDKGTCLFDFGFPVTERYFSVTAPALMSAPAPSYAVCAMDEAAYGNEALVCQRLFYDGTSNDGYFMIVIY